MVYVDMCMCALIFFNQGGHIWVYKNGNFKRSGVDGLTSVSFSYFLKNELPWLFLNGTVLAAQNERAVIPYLECVLDHVIGL